MKKVDTTSWRQFCVGELFDIIGGKGITKQEIYEHPGALPAIQSGEENFGCIGYLDFDYCTSKKYVISKGECLTVARSGSSGYVGYQASQCVVGDSAKILEPKFKANTLRLLYIRAALMVLKAKYAYTDKVTNENYAKATILLPSKNEEPDWQYMEDYMRRIEQNVQRSISALKDAQNGRLKIDHSYWKEFSMKELGFVNFHGQRLTKKDRVEGTIPFITAGKENQGVAGTIGNERTTYHNAITIDMFGNVFYHKGDFAGDDNIYFFVNDSVNEFCKQFIVVSAQRQIRSTFEYKDQFRQDNADTLSVKLPATPAGGPDWHYMEMYMRGIEAIVKNKLSLLVPHKQELALKDAANVTFNNATVTYIDQSKTYNVK